MSKIQRIILIVVFVTVISLTVLSQLVSNHNVKAYHEWHEGELNITDVKPWYNMHLENDHVTMKFVITNYTNRTHEFFLQERIFSLSNPEIAKELPNSTLLDDITLQANSNGTIPFSQQLPVGSWFLSVMMMADSPNGIEVDYGKQFFVVEPMQDLYSYGAVLATIILAVATIGLVFFARNQTTAITSTIQEQRRTSRLAYAPFIWPRFRLNQLDGNPILYFENIGNGAAININIEMTLASGQVKRFTRFAFSHHLSGSIDLNIPRAGSFGVEWHNTEINLMGNPRIITRMRYEDVTHEPYDIRGMIIFENNEVRFEVESGFW